ncbi:MAG: ABC transporter substrate-binding protein [Sphaerochaetaceae bacterium]|jgi:multiple sugar transport system substrate-binding protein
MKRLLVILMVALCALSLVVAKGSSEKQITINFATQSTPTMDYLVSLIPEFEAETGIKVVADLMPYDSLVQKVTIDTTTNTKQYAAFWMEPTWLGRFEDEFEDISKYINDPVLGKGFNLDDFSKPFLDETVRINGKTLGLPFEGCLLVIAYREDLYQKYGLSEPKSLQEHLDNARMLNLKEPGVYGVTMMGKRGQPVFYEYMPYMYGYGASFFDSNMNPTVNTPEAVKALEYMIELSKNAPRGVSSFGWEEAATEFLQGNAGAGLLFTDWLPTLKDSDSSTVAGLWNFTAVPAGPGGQGSPAGTINLGINADVSDAEKRAAFQFINWATSAEMQARLAVVGATPTRLSVLDAPEFATNEYRYFDALKDTYDITITPMKIPEFFELNDALSIELSAAISGEKSAKAALDKAQAEWVKIMRDAH